MNIDNHFRQHVEQRIRRLARARRERTTILGQSLFMGTLGLLMVLPLVGGAYLGRWLDGMAEGYSIRWTISCLFLGIVVGGVSVYLQIKE